MKIKRHQHGVVLLEALIASLILAIGLIGAIGLQARAYSAISESSMRSEATLAIESLFGLMNSDQDSLASYALAAGAPCTASQLLKWCTATQAAIPGASIVIVVAPPVAPSKMSTVTATISWTRKANAATNSQQATTYIAPST